MPDGQDREQADRESQRPHQASVAPATPADSNVAISASRAMADWITGSAVERPAALAEPHLEFDDRA